ncbi:MAG: Na+/H+ antiporter NhaC family protein [Candidatus Electryonea clarkiae]|nr:Na+/H+ antiporter NhaC family protein [Candidatus Electryonea clarkiae]MDP8288083.1 Na+/H+ antiporter NhaC family protein [Candidatus Electryonea clarkiae]
MKKIQINISARLNKLNVAVILSLLFVTAAFAITSETSSHPGWWAILPPIIAIGLALTFKEVIISLLMGVFVGSLILNPTSPAKAFMDIPSVFVWDALADKGHAAIVLFSLMLGGMVGIISKSGGTAAIVRLFGRLTSSRRGGMLMTYLLGLVIFFDDYANTLLVGNTMRPYTDRLKISRAKLAYIVDSTAAPVTSIAVISTWVGFEVGLLRDATASFPGIGDAYVLFLKAIPYHFYSILALFLVFILIMSGRDFGPMKEVELETQEGNDASKSQDFSELHDENKSDRSNTSALIAVIPIFLVIIATFIGLYVNGLRQSPPGSKMFEIIGQADSSTVLLNSSFIGLISSGLFAGFMSRMSIGDISKAMIDGIKSMIPAFVILILAWSIGDVCARLGTAEVIINAVSGKLPPFLLPVVIFLIAAVVAFSTGTSWGTMAILIPIAIPLAFQLPLQEGIAANQANHILLGSIGAVLAGATFGDHCSPISDTTILSSMASGCDHVAHVRTQIPYALTAGMVAIIIGYLPAGLGLPGWIGLLLGVVALLLIMVLLKYRKRTGE